MATEYLLGLVVPGAAGQANHGRIDREPRELNRATRRAEG